MAMFMIAGGQDRDDDRPPARVLIGCVDLRARVADHGLAPNLPILVLGWSVLEGLGAALILPAIVALVA